jgi:TPR repeat protein
MTRRAFVPRDAGQTQRCSGPLRVFLALITAAVLLWHTSNAYTAGPPVRLASSSAAKATLPAVTIEASRKLQQQVDHFVTSEVVQPPGESLMRWNTPVCPFAVGLPRMFDEYIQAHISQIARAANAPVAGKHCRANLYVIATYQPDLLLKKLRARAPWMYHTRNGPGDVEGFPDSQRPVRVLFNSNLQCRINGISGGIGADMVMKGVGGGGQVNTTTPYYCSGGESRLSYSSVKSVSSALIVVDMTRMKKISTRQLADYVAMIGLADFRLDSHTGSVPTILRLFQDPQRPPDGLSAWDRALLYSLYTTNQWSVLQVEDIETRVLDRIKHQDNPEQAFSGSSTAVTPLWANEVLPQRDTNAVDWYRAAAEQGDSDAEYALGVLYARGQGVPQNYAQAAQWYRNAASRGNAQAQSSLGSAYANGQGVPQDYRKAAEWYRKAAEQGDVNAQYNLGILYANGRGVSQDYVSACLWYRKAAEQGNANAQTDLGVAYANGQGVPRNDAKAAQWFSKAAERADAEAQYNLAVMYYSGRGVPQDSVRAYEWWTLAKADSSSNDAYELSLHKLTEARSRMTADQIARAHRAAAEWLSGHRPIR